MAMRENLRNLEAVQNTALTLQQQKEAERKKKQEEKENKQRLEYDVKIFLKKEFERYIFSVGSSYTSEFYFLDRKKELLEEAKENLLEKKLKTWENGEVTSFYDKKNIMIIENFFDKYYYKILKDICKQKQLEEEASFWKQCEQVEPKKPKNNIDIISIIKPILFILFLPLLFIISILFGVMKNQK